MRSVFLLFIAVAAAFGQGAGLGPPVNGQRLAGLSLSEWPSGDGGPPTDAFLVPLALAFDRDGSLLIADIATQHIRRLTPSGAISTVFDYTRVGLHSIAALAVDSQQNM